MKQELLNDLRRLEEPQLYTDLYTDPLTGVLNRRAFDKDLRPFVAVVDLDSLKYVNDSFSYRWGDFMLETIAHALVEAFGSDNVYRLHGDEFAVKSEHVMELRSKLLEVRAATPCFSAGLGLGIHRADVQLKEEKKRREAQGLRASRGECPPWIEQLEEHMRVDQNA